MSLKERIESDYREAFKEGNIAKVNCLRLLKAAVKNAEIQKRRNFEDNEVLEVVIKEAKQRRDSIEAFRRGGRQDLVKRENESLEILNQYLPAQLSKEELREITQEIIKALGANSEKDFGRVMKEVIAKVKGQARGQLVSQIVKEELSASKKKALISETPPS